MTRLRRVYRSDIRQHQIPKPPSIPSYAGGIPADMLAEAQRLGEHALSIVNGLAQAGDSVAARAVPSLVDCIARIKGALAGIERPAPVMPDPASFGRLD